MRSQAWKYMARAAAGAALLLAAADPSLTQSGVPAAAALAAETVPEDRRQSVVRELAGLNRTLQQIQGVLERLLVQQELDLLMKRIDLKARRLAPLQSELRGIRGSIESTNGEMKRSGAFKKQLQAELERYRELRRDTNGSAEERSLQDVESEIDLIEERLETLQRRQIEVEDELAARRQEIQFLEDALDERLGLR